MERPVSIHLRKATAADLDDILQLFVDTIQRSCKKDYTESEIQAWTASIEDREKWLGRIERQYFLLAEAANTLAGFASLEGNYFDCLYVHPDFQGAGVALSLYQSVKEEAQRKDHTELLSDVSYTARPFFERQGFAVVHQNHNEIRGEVLVNFRMRKEVQ